MSTFLPPKFKVPTLLQTEKFLIRPLKISDVVKDYDAVMSSLTHLEGIFGPNYRWPYPELTLEQDLIDLGWHQKEFQKRSSFAYTVMNIDESICLGCIYINPSDKENFDAEVFMWIRTSAYKDGLDDILFNTVKEWVANEWPFENVAYPGRDITWEEWEGIK
jgi:hypothetical protein